MGSEVEEQQKQGKPRNTYHVIDIKVGVGGGRGRGRGEGVSSTFKEDIVKHSTAKQYLTCLQD